MADRVALPRPRRETLLAAKGEIAELDRVRLLGDLITKDGTLPLGAEGTAVHRYRDGAAFEIEVERPFHAIATLRAGEIARLDG